MNNRRSELHPTTRAAYSKTAAWLERRARASILADDPKAIPGGKVITPMQLVAWLIKGMRAGEFRQATWRQYKASLLYALQSVNHDENAEAIEYLRNTMHSPSETAVRIPARTSARRAKAVKPHNLEKLVSYIANQDRPYYKLASLWMVASYHVGLRPCEWQKASLVHLDGLPYIKAVNAKNTHGRSHGQYRHIPIHHLDEDIQEMIRVFLVLLHDYLENESMEFIATRVRSVVYRAGIKILKRRHKGVSLYTMRHMFSANAKNTNTPQETGALMGHAVDETCTTHYGKARFGRAIPGLSPIPEEVARVRKTAKNPHTQLPENGEINNN